MKLNPNSTQQQIFKHPWYDYVDRLNKPNPPSQEAIEKAKFIDKTYQWSGDDSIRPK